MRGLGRVWQLAVIAAGYAVLPGHALAQSPSDFRLPSSRPTAAPPPRVQGPVDPDNPVITAPRPAPRPSPSATVPAPSPSITAQPVIAAQPSAAAPRSAASPRQTAPGRPVPNRAVQPGPLPQLPSPAAPAAQGTPVPAPLPSATPIFSTLPGKSAAPVPAASAPATAWQAWFPLAGAVLAALLVAIGGLIWWRRRAIDAPVSIAFERPIVPADLAPAADPNPAQLAPQPQPVAAAPALATTPLPKGLILSLEARRMSASLMATTLSYQLSVTNHTATALSALAIEGDMIGAHGALPPEQQVARKTQQLELRHAVVELAPGETAVLTGDIRVPLELITPIRAGTAAFFVPLARFRVSAGPLVVVQTFVIGEAPETAGAALKPFRLDLGPRTYSRISQRALD